MTVQRPDLEPNTQPIPRVVSGERRRAAIALGVLAVAAIVLVLIMVQLLGGSSDPGPSTVPVGLPSGPAVTVTGGAPSQQSSAPTGSRAPVSTPHRTPSTGPRRGPVSCPTSSPCALNDDVGDVLGALNAYRAKNGQQPVTGSVTAGAKTCALTQANSCPNGFFWEPVGRSGKQVVDKIVTNGEGGKLLAPGLKHVEIGWAYLPSSHSFWCALVANPS